MERFRTPSPLAGRRPKSRLRDCIEMTAKKMAFLFIIYLLCIISAAHAENISMDTYPFTSTTDASRFQSLTKEIRCVVCQNQNIADSNAPLANDLRNKIYQLTLENQPNEAIKKYLSKRYGDYILLEPRINRATILLWAFPGICLIFIFLFLCVQFRKSKE